MARETGTHTGKPEGDLLGDRQAQGRSRTAKQAGFTIVELLIVLALLSLAASVGIPAYFGRPSVTLDNAAKLLAKDLREVQNRAALYEEILMIRFPEDGSGYVATDAAGDSLISPYGAGEFRRNYPGDAVFRGVRVKSVSAGGDRAISFSPEGRPSEPAEIVLEFRGEERAVLIRERSGLLSIDGLDEPWIDLGD
ncbi:hypothetical protein Poly30_46190 [Planctomycetes bacterium Poly30]|uniref:General secretion pathway GspH domain-containing protein n=1 Tax=Saltatorellus ferox TaxID=2528018 RepID=A0A518EYA4_9BACT|nr:hypothetical protein Poly30_46190 [Planctomycetes bacterium Poly30]